jgi:hypothetical protein
LAAVGARVGAPGGSAGLWRWPGSFRPGALTAILSRTV